MHPTLSFLQSYIDKLRGEPSTYWWHINCTLGGAHASSCGKVVVPFWLPSVPSRKNLGISMNFQTVLVISYNWWTMTLRAKHMLWAKLPGTPSPSNAHRWTPEWAITACLPTMNVIMVLSTLDTSLGDSSPKLAMGIKLCAAKLNG